MPALNFAFDMFLLNIIEEGPILYDLISYSKGSYNYTVCCIFPPSSLSILTMYYLHLLQAAEEPARGAPERPVEVDDLVAVVVGDLHVKRPDRAAAVPDAAVGVLFGLEHLKPHSGWHLNLALIF